MRVQYECSKCSWRNEELPYQEEDYASMLNEDYFTPYYNESSKASSIASAVY
jgi:hypothetical protein